MTENFSEYTTAQIRAFKSLAISELILFSFAMTLLLVNVYFFVIRQRTYRIYFILTFYIFSFLVFISRLGLASILTIASFEYNKEWFQNKA